MVGYVPKKLSVLVTNQLEQLMLFGGQCAQFQHM